MAHKHLSLSTSFVTVHLAESFINFSLSFHVARLVILPNFSPVIDSVNIDVPSPSLLLLVRPVPVPADVSPCRTASSWSSPVLIPTSDNAYTFYTDGSLRGLGSSSVSIGWS